MHVAIIGNGISGTTAARFIRKLSDHKVTMISAETDYPYSRTALMYIYMGHEEFRHIKLYRDEFYAQNKIDLVRGRVKSIDFDDKVLHFDTDFSVQTPHPAPKQLQYDVLLVATGSKSNTFGWKGQDLDGVHGLYSYQDLQAMENESEGLKRAVIVGGGLIGIEMAEMFHSRGIPVTFLVREDSYWDNVLPKEESTMVNREIERNDIDLRLKTDLKEILADDNGHCKAVVTKDGEEISCGFVGLTPGVHPNIALLEDSPVKTDQGVLVDEFLSTNVEDVYAIGDCAQLKNPPKGRQSIEAVWYAGKIMGETVSYTICGHPTKYKPGVWFNSAKFFDIEYSVYGNVPSEPEESLSSIYWQHQDGKKSVRVVYENSGKVVKGFNLMGVRFRHELCDAWIEHQCTMPQILSDLKSANFDPEFYKTMETELVRLYNEKEGTELRIKSKRNLTSFFQSLRKIASG